MAKMMNEEALQGNLRMIEMRGERAFAQARAAGTLTPRQERLSQLMTDGDFLARFLAAESAEEARDIMVENGLEVTVEEVNAFVQQLVSVSRKLAESGDELTEEELEAVVGGVTGAEVVAGGAVLSSAGAGAGIGTLIFPGVGTCIGLLAGCIGGLALGVEGTNRGWFEKAAENASFKIKTEIHKIKVVSRWIRSWF